VSPRALRSLATSLLAAAAVALGACASGSHPARAAAASPGTPWAWELPAGAVPSQRIYQGSYEGPEGGGSFRATLRLQAPDRFRVDASDRLGRLFWSAGLEGVRGWWIDHREGTWCDDLERLTLPGVGTGPAPAAALPAILLGALPATPVGSDDAPKPRAAQPQLDIHDAAGRRWSATLESGRVQAWTLYDGDEPAWWWRRKGRGGVLSQRQGRQLEWQEVVAEPLRGGLPTFAPPNGYARSCPAVR
jgi:hypothetical protein